MRVLQVIHSLRRGGAERISLELAGGLLDRHHATLLVALLGVNDYIEAAYRKVEYQTLLPPEEYKWPGCVPELAKRFKNEVDRFRPDIVVTHNATASFVVAYDPPTVPIIQVIHGYGDFARPKAVRSLIRRLADRWCFRRLGARAIVVAPAMITTAARHFGCSIDRITCIPNGVNIDQFPFIEREIPTSPVICIVGTVSEAKRTHVAIDAIKKLRLKIPNAKLLVVGDGPASPTIRKLIREQGLAEAVQMLGSRTDITSILHDAHVLWQLSGSEGAPLAVAEAMATGLPIVGTDVRGTRELVVSGVTGFLVPLDNAGEVAEQSHYLLNNPIVYTQCASKGRERIVENYTSSTMVERYEHCFQEAALRTVRPL